MRKVHIRQKLLITASQPASRPARTANLSQYRFSIFPHLEKIVFFLIPRGGGDFSRALVNKLPPSPHPASSSQPRPLTTTAPFCANTPRPRLPLLQGGHGSPGCSGSTILRCAPRFCASCMTPPVVWTSVRLSSSRACLHSQPRAERALNPASP